MALNDIVVARGVRERLRGWLGRHEAPRDEGLLLVPCDSIHTIGLRFPIDVVLLDGEGRVLGCRHALRPWRLAFAWRTRAVLELPAGTLRASGLHEASRLGFRTADRRWTPAALVDARPCPDRVTVERAA